MHMGEIDGASHPENISSLINQTEIDKGDGWTEEQKTGEFQQIKSDMDKLRQGLYGRSGSPGMPKEATPVVQMTYSAAAELTEATRVLFENPSKVAEVPENRDNLNTGESGSARWRFMVNLTRALEQVNITPEELDQVKSKIDESDVYFAKKDWNKGDDR